MKTRIIYIITFICIAFAAVAQKDNKKVVTADIKVYGNCGMCKERIEAALDTKGVKQAKWDPTTKNLNVVYVPDRKSTRLNSSHSQISYAVFCLKKKNKYRRS